MVNDFDIEVVPFLPVYTLPVIESKPVCNWCGTKVTPSDLIFIDDHDDGLIHAECLEHRKEDESGVNLIAFMGFIVASLVVIVIGIHFGLLESGR